MTQVMNILDGLTEKPAHFADCCAGVSKPLIKTLVDRMPQSPAMILSIGCGSGLLEATLLSYRDHEQRLNLYGVEVPPCVNKYLPEDRLLRVPCTKSLHPDAILASTLLFVYPRDPMLIAMYLDASQGGALEQLIWLGHKSDWPVAEKLLLAAFFSLECIHGPGIPEYELLAIATHLR